MKPNKKNAKDDSLSGEIRHLAVLVEKMDDKIDLVAEGYLSLERKIGELDENLSGRLGRVETRLDGVETRLGRVETRLDGVETRLGQVETRLDGVETRLDGVETRLDGVETEVSDIKSGQSQILEYLSRIEDELRSVRNDLEENYEKKGHDALWKKQIENRLADLEKALKQKKFSGAILRDE